MIFLVRDTAGMVSVHEAEDKEEAAQRHLLHYGLLSMSDNTDIFETPDEKPCRDEPCGTLTRKELGL